MHNFTISGLDSLVVLSQYLCHQCSAVLFLPCSMLSVGNCWSAAAVCSSSSPWLGPCRQHTTWTPTSSATPPSSPGSPTLSSPFKPQDLNSTLPGHWVSIVCGICGSVMVNQLSAGSVLGTRVPLLSSYTLCFFCFFFPPSGQLMLSTTPQVMVSWAWMKMESHPGTSSATSTSWGLRYLQCFTWTAEHGLSVYIKFHS